MYSFAQRKDTTVIDEPLFGYFLEHTGVDRPSREEALACMEKDANKVIADLLALNDSPVYFIKHIANHLIDLDWTFIKGFKNIILTRHPKDVLTSYTKNIETPTLLDTAYQIQAQLLDHLIMEHMEFAVFDSTEILKNPEYQLIRMCEFAGIPFDKNMLNWSAGARPEDGVWARYWYHNVHKSTGFAPYREKDEQVPERLSDLYNECLTYYDHLKQYAL